MRRRSEPRDPNTSDRLEAYVARTETPLDILALVTLWIVAVPIESFGAGDDVTWQGLALRLALSSVFGADLAIRAALAPRSVRYVLSHPVRLLAVVIPPVRVVFSFRLISSLFVRGNLTRFLFAAAILILDGALIVYFYERGAADATITSPGGAIWWGIVTVATVGYGDMYPITVGGRVVASLMMAIGITTIAVVTAQVSSSFVSQAKATRRSPLHQLLGHRGPEAGDDPGTGSGDVAAGDDGTPAAARTAGDDDGAGADDDVVTELLDRLDRIERQLTELRERPGT